MKKIKLGILGIVLMFFMVPSAIFSEDLKLVSFPTGYFGQDTLINTPEDKVPIDTLLVNLVDFTNYGDFDTLLVYLKMDTVVGLYGGHPADSLGRSALGIYSHPVVRHPARVRSYETATLLDTLSGELQIALEDSVLNTGVTKVYVQEIRFPQYYIYIKHNYGDTSNANPQARTVYEGWIGLKKKGKLVVGDVEGLVDSLADKVSQTGIGDTLDAPQSIASSWTFEENITVEDTAFIDTLMSSGSRLLIGMADDTTNTYGLWVFNDNAVAEQWLFVDSLSPINDYMMVGTSGDTFRYYGRHDMDTLIGLDMVEVDGIFSSDTIKALGTYLLIGESGDTIKFAGRTDADTIVGADTIFSAVYMGYIFKTADATDSVLWTIGAIKDGDLTITGYYDFTDDTTRFKHIRTDTISGRPDLNVNTDAWGDVKLFSGDGTIANTVDGRHFIIYRNETGDIDSLEFYIDQSGHSYIKSSNHLLIDVEGNILLDANTGKVEIKKAGNLMVVVMGYDSEDQLVFQTFDNTGNQIIIGNVLNDYDIPLQNNPLLAIFSDLDPNVSNNHSLKFKHDSSGGIISSGAQIGTGSAPDTIDNQISIFPRDGTAGLTVDGDGNVTLTDTLWVLDPAGDDSIGIYDDGTTLKIISSNPIEFTADSTNFVKITADTFFVADSFKVGHTVTINGSDIFIDGVNILDMVSDSTQLFDEITEISGALDSLADKISQTGIGDTLDADQTIDGDWTINGLWDFNALTYIMGGETLVFADAAGNDSLTIFEDGDTSRIVSSNPIKIGNTSLIIGTDGNVTANESLFVFYINKPGDLAYFRGIIDADTIRGLDTLSGGTILATTFKTGNSVDSVIHTIGSIRGSDLTVTGNWIFSTTDSTDFNKVIAETLFVMDSLKVGHTVSINGNAIYISGTDILDMVMDSVKNTISDTSQELKISYASPDSELIFNSGRGANNIAGGINIVNYFFSTDAIWDSLGLHSEGIDSTRCKVDIEHNIRRNTSNWYMEDIVTGHVDSTNTQHYSAYFFWVPPKDFASFDSISTVSLFAETGADVDLIIYRHQKTDSVDVGTITTTHDAYFDKEVSAANIGTLNNWACYRYDKFVFQYTAAVTNTAEARLGRLKIVYNKR